MAKQIINIGTSANKGNGDPLRTAFAKVNENFTELYSALGLNADVNLNIGAFEFVGSVMSTTDSTAITIDQATTVTSNLTVGGNIIPSVANGGNLGSPTNPWNSLYVSNSTIYLGNVPLSLDANNNLTVNGSLVTGGGSSVTTSTTAPVSPSVGDLWYDTASGRTYVYYDSNWIDSNPSIIPVTDKLVNGSAEVVLGSNGVLTFPNGETLLSQPSQLYFHKDDNDYVGEIVLQAEGVSIQATHPTLGNSLINISTNSATISINNNEWEFDRSGTLTTPLLLPKTFTAVLDSAHKTGAALTLTDTPWEFTVQFQVNPNGTVETMLNSIFPNLVNPGYTTADQFSFTEADHGIPGYTFELELDNLVLSGPAGWTASPVVSIPPEYPSTVKSLGAVKLTSNTNSWVFGTDGNITLPDGAKIKSTSSLEGQLEIEVPGGMTEAQSWRFTGEEGIGALYFPDGGRYIASTLYSAVDSDLDFIVSYRPRISHQCYIGTEGEFVADIEFNDDIIAAGVGWTVEVDGTTYTVESVVEGAPANQFRLIVPGATFVSTETYTFINPDAVSKSWTINSQNGTLIASGGAILSSESSPLGGGGTYRDFSIELPTPDGLNEQRWVFANDGDFTAPGDIFAGSFLGQSLEITDAGIVASTYAGDLQTLHVAGAVGKGLTLGVDGGLVSWLFKPNGTLTLPQYHMIESVGSNATITLNALGTNESSIYISTNLDGETIGSSFEIHPNGFGLNSVRDVDIHAGYDYATFKYDAWVDAEQAWTDIRDQDAATIAPETRSWAGLPSYEAYDILMAYLQDPPLGDTPPPSGMAPVANTAKAAYEQWQAEQAAINVTVRATDKTWTFGADGNLTVAGAIRRDEYLYLNSNGTTDKTATVSLNGDAGRVFIRTIDGLDQNEWYFKEDGTMQFPDFTSYTGKDITVPLGDSLTVNMSFDSGPNNINTSFKVNPGSIKLPTGNGYIYSNGDTDASLWCLDSANKTLFFPDAGDGVFPQIRYSTVGDDGIQLFTAAKPIKITTASNTHWTFGTTGDITLPAGGDILDSNGDSVLGGGGGSVVGITSSATSTYNASVDWNSANWDDVRDIGGFTVNAIFYSVLNGLQPGDNITVNGTDSYVIDHITISAHPTSGYYFHIFTTSDSLARFASITSLTFDIVDIQLAGNTTVESNLIINSTIHLKSGADIKNSAGDSVLRREPSFEIKTAGFTAVAGHRYGINTTSGAITVYLPTTPVAGDAIFFVDSHGTFATNNFTIDGNDGWPYAKTIMGQATQVSTTNNENIGLFYNGTEWRFYA